MNRYQYHSGDLSEDSWISYPNNEEEVGDLYEIAEELNRLRDWIILAAPVFSAACCIVIDDSVERLDEIAGCRGILEMCPVEHNSWEDIKSASKVGIKKPKPVNSHRLLRDLIDVGTGKIPHKFAGQCPDAVDGHDQRDKSCRACRILMRAESNIGND